MIRPDFIGKKSLYLNPGAINTFSTAELAAIDTPLTGHLMQPYAYTAVVNDYYDTMNVGFDDSATGSDIVAYRRVAFGLFLSPDNSKGNLLFQVSGRASISLEDGGYVFGNFFFGRKATDNTVVSSKAAQSNELARYILLPSISDRAASSFGLSQSCEDEVFTLALDGGFVYCFGYAIDNPGAAAITIHGEISLSFRKYSSELGVFRPSR